MQPIVLHHPVYQTRYRALAPESVSSMERLLVEVVREGRVVYILPTIEAMRAQREADLERLDPGVRRLMNPHVYHVSLSERLWNLKQDLMASAQRQGR